MNRWTATISNPTNSMMSLGFVSFLALIMLAGCKQENQKEQNPVAGKPKMSESGTAAAGLPAGLLVSQNLPNPKSVAEVKADATITGDVVIAGRIGGNKQPFVEGLAMFMLADNVMKTCDEKHGDACPTPWDYCCEPEESLKANLAMIQVVGDDGKPIRTGLESKLKPSARVTIAGKVASREGGSLLINAEKIYVQP
ncbi:MAG: hypothetical protein ACPGXK_10625 [Phycisphaerae bacterium]